MIPNENKGNEQSENPHNSGGEITGAVARSQNFWNHKFVLLLATFFEVVLYAQSQFHKHGWNILKQALVIFGINAVPVRSWVATSKKSIILKSIVVTRSENIVVARSGVSRWIIKVYRLNLKMVVARRRESR